MGLSESSSGSRQQVLVKRTFTSPQLVLASQGPITVAHLPFQLPVWIMVSPELETLLVWTINFTSSS